MGGFGRDVVEDVDGGRPTFPARPGRLFDRHPCTGQQTRRGVPFGRHDDRIGGPVSAVGRRHPVRSEIDHGPTQLHDIAQPVGELPRDTIDAVGRQGGPAEGKVPEDEIEHAAWRPQRVVEEHAADERSKKLVDHPIAETEIPQMTFGRRVRSIGDVGDVAAADVATQSGDAKFVTERRDGMGGGGPKGTRILPGISENPEPPPRPDQGAAAERSQIEF